MSVNKIPNNQFTQGLNVSGGLTVDSLVVNGTSITSGTGVVVSTDINNNSATNVPSTSITYSLKQTNDNQTTQINTNTGQITELRAAMDAVYGGSALSWIGLGTVAFASGSTFMPKSGGTFSGDVAHGTNNITSVKDVKFSNALIGASTSNVYCSNLVASNVFGWFNGNGSQLTNLPLDVAQNFGTNNDGNTVVGKVNKVMKLQGVQQTDLIMGGSRSVIGGLDFISSNAVITNNVYATGNVVASGNVYASGFFIGDGSKLTGISATGADASGSLNFATSGTLVNSTSVLGSGLNYGGTLQIGASTTDHSPTLNINAGANFNQQGETVSINSTLNSLQLNNLWDKATYIGKPQGTTAVNIQGGSLTCNHNNTINPRGIPHYAKQTGFVQSMVIPLSGEQGVIAQTLGAGVLPWFMMRAPFPNEYSRTSSSLCSGVKLWSCSN